MTPGLVRLGAVVLVALGAGCSAVTPPTNSLSSTVAAASVPSASPTSWPLGVARTGVVDHRELVAAHRTRLEDTNYTVTVTESTRWQNGSVNWRRTRVTTRDENRVFAVLERSGTPVLRDTTP